MNATVPARHSLRRRLAGWMLVSTLLTMLVFTGVLYLAFVIEDGEADDAEEDEEEGAESAVDEAAEQMLLAVAIAGPFALVAAVGGALWLSRRALAPLDDVIRAARAITSADLHRRLELPRERDEIHALVVELNGLFERLQHGFDALGRYAVDASHELRTPLAVVVSELDVALRRPRTAAEWEPVAERVRGELRRLTRLVESLLALARADGPSACERRFDLREQVDMLLMGLADQARGWQIELSRVAQGGDSPSWVRGDPDAIDAALRNLIMNAMQYSPAGGVVVVAVDTDADGVSVIVDDGGAGVPPDDREAIFQPMRRGRARVVDRNGEGHGLGLAIAARIVDGHRGRLWVEGSPAGGARFVMTLPSDAAPES
jgi:signal transduction histidine kinase